jgi:anaerobic ribonucleoside-triphosphate reductase
MKELPVMDLESELSRGLKVEHITRVTGYFAKVNSWNPGKKGELQDRHRADI